MDAAFGIFLQMCVFICVVGFDFQVMGLIKLTGCETAHLFNGQP